MIAINAATAAVLVTAAAGVVASSAAAVSPRHTPTGLAVARAALLRRGDLGRGWSQQSPPPAKVPGLACPGFDPSVGGAIQTGAAASPTFGAGPSGPFVSEASHAYATAGEQATVWQALARPGLVRCAAASLRRGGGDGVTFTVTGQRTLGLPGLPAPAAGYRASGTASLPDQIVDVYLDMFVVGRGTAIAEIVLSSFEQPPPRGLELHLLRTVARRMSAR